MNCWRIVEILTIHVRTIQVQSSTFYPASMYVVGGSRSLELINVNHILWIIFRFSFSILFCFHFSFHFFLFLLSPYSSFLPFFEHDPACNFDFFISVARFRMCLMCLGLVPPVVLLVDTPTSITLVLLQNTLRFATFRNFIHFVNVWRRVLYLSVMYSSGHIFSQFHCVLALAALRFPFRIPSFLSSFMLMSES